LSFARVAIPYNTTDDYAAEAKQYMDSSQTVEKRLEATAAIVKEAYSEVPSPAAAAEVCKNVRQSQSSTARTTYNACSSQLFAVVHDE